MLFSLVVVGCQDKYVFIYPHLAKSIQEMIYHAFSGHMQQVLDFGVSVRP